MLKYIKKYLLFAMLAPLFMLGEVSMDLIQPQMMKLIVDEGVLGISNGGTGDLNLVISTGLHMIGLVLFGGFCGVMSGVFANLCSQNYGNDMRKDAFSKIMTLSFEQTDRFSTGSLITRVTNDITQIQNLVSQAIRGFIRTFLLFAGGILCMLSLDLSFGVVIACALPLVTIFVIYFIRKANPIFGVLQGKLDHVNNVMQENVSGARVVKAFVREKHEEERFGRANGELVGTQLNVLLLFSYMTPLMNIVLNVSIVAIIKIGGIQVQNGSATPGIVMAAITYLSQILNAVMRMTMIFQTVSRGVASGKRVKEILDCEPVIADGTCNIENRNEDNSASKMNDSTSKMNVNAGIGIGNDLTGTVIFEHVSFAYPGVGGEKVLDDINLSIKHGETFAIMGATGSGKSSLVNLIPRSYDVTEGRVLVDGRDVKDYRLRDLRDRISVTLQNSEIFSTTIRENISWGNAKAEESQIHKAAEIAQATEFIDQLPDGYDTEVAEGGNSLSGGQKQRLSISRSVLKNSEILILDDSTSALDLKTEARLYQALEAEKKDVTKIIIAQRISSVKNADRILVLENGRVAALGNHKELMKNSSIYQDIYNSQLRKGDQDHE